MKLLTIVADQGIEYLSTQIHKEIAPYLSEGIQIKEEVEQDGAFTSIHYYIEKNSVKNYPVEDFVSLFKYSIANALWDYIYFYEERNLINKIIRQEFCYFDEKEKNEIQKNAEAILKEEKVQHNALSQGNHTRKSKVLKKLIAHFNQEAEINLKGFMDFRLKEYVMDLEETVEHAIEDYLSDREYNEFIKLLKYFVDIQEPRAKEVHLVLGRDNRFNLYDENYNVIGNDYLLEIASEMITENMLSYEDLLMSALITMAPSKIIIHQFSGIHQSDMVKTVNRVFSSKVTLCVGCDLCFRESLIPHE